MNAAVSFYLPWDFSPDDQRRLRAALAGTLLVLFVMGVLIPLVDLPERQRVERPAVTLTRISLEKPEVVEPPPPPPPPVVEKPKVAEVKPVPKPVALAPKPKVEVPKAVEPPKPSQQDLAALASLSAFEDAFADMRDPAQDVAPASQLQRGPGEAASVDRSVITARHGRRDLGIAATGVSTPVRGLALGDRTTTQVAAPVDRDARAAAGNNGATSTARGSDTDAGRSTEEIRRVFDANKGVLFALYQGSLSDQPGLAGKVVLELVIAPDGSVTRCRAISTEIDDPSLVQRVVDRVRGFRFSPQNVSTTTVTYPVHFLPS